MHFDMQTRLAFIRKTRARERELLLKEQDFKMQICHTLLQSKARLTDTDIQHVAACNERWRHLAALILVGPAQVAKLAVCLFDEQLAVVDVAVAFQYRTALFQFEIPKRILADRQRVELMYTCFTGKRASQAQVRLLQER